MRRAKARKRHEKGQMNLTEKAYSQVLNLRMKAGEIDSWRFEPLQFVLANKTHFTPDFMVVLADGTVELHEVKAMTKKGKVLAEDDARVKLKVAASMYYEFRFFLVVKVSPTQGGGWRYDEISGSFNAHAQKAIE